MDLPDDLPVEHRSAVRLVVLDEDDQVLLFHTRDPGDATLGTWWELPGGGIDTGKSYVDAAVRETGLTATQVDHRLPDLLPALLAGDRVDEPFETWS